MYSFCCNNKNCSSYSLYSNNKNFSSTSISILINLVSFGFLKSVPMAVEAQFYSESLYPTTCFGLQDSNPISGFDDLRFGFVNGQQSQFPLQPSSGRNHPVSSPAFGDPILSMAYARPLKDDLELLGQEMDCILQFHDEQLRLLVYHQRKLQLEAIFDSFRTKSLSLMMQKEDDLARAVKRSMELNEYLKKAETEKENVQKLVTEQDAILKWLNISIEQAKERMGLVGTIAEDTESAISWGKKARENARKSVRKLACRRCSTQISCILLLPCGHLCSCEDCEPFLDSCPVCGYAKATSVEALLV